MGRLHICNRPMCIYYLFGQINRIAPGALAVFVDKHDADELVSEVGIQGVFGVGKVFARLGAGGAAPGKIGGEGDVFNGARPYL